MSVLFQGSSAPAVVLEPPLPGITPYRTHVPVKITNVQLGTLQTLGPMPANGGEDSLAHDVLLKGTTVCTCCMMPRLVKAKFHYATGFEPDSVMEFGQEPASSCYSLLAS